MSNISLNYAQIIDPLSFKSINLAKIYIGEYGTLPNPANAATWKQAYFVNSDGTRTAASQPIRTNAAGFAVDGSGNIKTVQVDGGYSLLAQDQFGATKFSTAKAADIWADLASSGGAGLVGYSQSGGQASTVQDVLREQVNIFDFIPQAEWSGIVARTSTYDCTSAVNAALTLASSSAATREVVGRGRFCVSDTIRIPHNVRLRGRGRLTFKWVGSAPSAGSKKPVISCASNDPTTTAVSVDVDDFSIDCSSTANLYGIEFIYAINMSVGAKIRVDDVGVNGGGFRFAKIWYADFGVLSVRNSAKTAGSIGFHFDTGSIATGEINGIKFKTLQSNKCSVGLLIDTTNYIYASEIDTLILEQGDVGVRHIGKKGVRQFTFQNVYLESNTVMVDWQKDAAATDTSSAVMWNNVQTQVGTSTWNIAEGRHWIRGCDSITTLNNTGAQIRVDGDGNIGTVNNSGGGRTLLVRGPTQLPQGNAYSSVYAKPQAAVAVRNVVAAATTVTTIPLPADLLNTSFPTYGREIKLAIYARKWSNTQNRYWEGYLVQRDNQTWGIFKSANASTEDSTWSVTVNSTTGELTITYTDTSEGKIVIAEYWPM